MVRMKPLSISDDQIDAILPVAGALVALIVLLVILVASAPSGGIVAMEPHRVAKVMSAGVPFDAIIGYSSPPGSQSVAAPPHKSGTPVRAQRGP
jgi:hypothetical protein